MRSSAAAETGGLSLARGAGNFLHDLATNEGQPQQFAAGVYEVGRDMAITPGKVVFRNDLMELIQYSPTTKTVHEIPLLFSPPWINKYYVMDLAPGRSLVEWAVNHGHTVFLISYRNPDESMRLGRDGRLPAVRADQGARCDRGDHWPEKVNLLGLCLGGTLTMITLAYLDSIGEERINCATFLNTLTDFKVPGALGVFTDESTVAKLEVSMAKTGFLPADNMQKTFNMMRSNDLIWNYVVNNWMKGEDPPAFDLLTWNADSTRMPAEMHSFYLRSCYLENQLARGVMEIAGETLNIKAVDQDLYFLAAEQDHIAPWRSSYTGAKLPTGEVRFVLSNSGHIAGIVNPPNPKSKHYVAEDIEDPAGRSGRMAGIGGRASGDLVGGLGQVDRLRGPASRSSRRALVASKPRPRRCPGHLRLRHLSSTRRSQIGYHSNTFIGACGRCSHSGTVSNTDRAHHGPQHYPNRRIGRGPPCLSTAFPRPSSPEGLRASAFPSHTGCPPRV